VDHDELTTKDSSVSELREAVAAAASATTAAAKASSVAPALGLHGTGCDVRLEKLHYRMVDM